MIRGAILWGSLLLAVGSAVAQTSAPPLLSSTKNADNINVQTLTPELLQMDHIVARQDSFMMYHQGQAVGYATVTYAFDEGYLTVTEETRVAAAQIDTEAAAVLEPTTLEPVHLSIQGPVGKVDTDVAVVWERKQETTWEADSVVVIGETVEIKGHSRYPREKSHPQGKRDLSQEASPPVWERTSLLWTAPTLPLKASLQEKVSYQLTWLNARDGQIEHPRWRTVSTEMVTVSAGTFETYRVRFDNIDPPHILNITTEAPRQVVRIEVVGLPWEYRLFNSTTP